MHQLDTNLHNVVARHDRTWPRSNKPDVALQREVQPTLVRSFPLDAFGLDAWGKCWLTEDSSTHTVPLC